MLFLLAIEISVLIAATEIIAILVVKIVLEVVVAAAVRTLERIVAEVVMRVAVKVMIVGNRWQKKQYYKSVIIIFSGSAEIRDFHSSLLFSSFFLLLCNCFAWEIFPPSINYTMLRLTQTVFVCRILRRFRHCHCRNC